MFVPLRLLLISLGGPRRRSLLLIPLGGPCRRSFLLTSLGGLPLLLNTLVGGLPRQPCRIRTKFLRTRFLIAIT